MSEVSMDIKRDLKFAMGWNRVNLDLVGIWPEPMMSRNQERSSNYKAFLSSLCVIMFIAGPQSANLFLLDGNLDLITENLCLANIPAINSIMKILFVWYHREDLKPIVQFFYDDWYSVKSEEERTTMTSNAKLSRYISTWCTVLTQTMVTAYLSLRAFNIMKCDRSAETQDRLILYPGYVPYNVRPQTALVLTNLAQAFSAYCATIPYTSVDAFIAMLVLHTCGQFEILRRRLEGLMDAKNGTRHVDKIQKELAWIVERHERLNWVVTRIEDCFNILLLIQMLLCTIEICVQGFVFFKSILQNEDGISKFQLIFFVLLVSFIVVHIYIYCYIGEILLNQSTGVGISAYNSSWFNVSPPEAKCLLLILCRSTKPLNLTAGKFGIFSMQMFSTILRTAVGYLSVLLTVSNSN